MVGTIASFLGGSLVGLAYYSALLLCVPGHLIASAPPQYLIVLVGALAGGVGSAIDSWLGATFQYSGIMGWPLGMYTVLPATRKSNKISK